MIVGSLFSGIGGFDLAARWMGWTTAWFSEIDPYASAVLKKHWPNVPNHGDITKISARSVEPVDILCGGFPCQDISVAGKGAGLDGERSGLWHHYARLIEEIHPRYAVIENSPRLRSLGLDQVLQKLSEIGYDAEWHCIPASYVGARHKRDRIWIVAYPACAQLEERLDIGGEDIGRAHAQSAGSSEGGERGENVADANGEYVEYLLNGRSAQGSRAPSSAGTLDLDEPDRSRGSSRSQDVADANKPDGERRSGEATQGQGRRSSGAEQPDVQRKGESCPDHAGPSGKMVADTDSERGCVRDAEREDAKNAGESPRCPLDGYWDVEPDVGRVANGVPSRVDRLRCIGNAVVPQIPFLIFQAIEQRELRLHA